MDDLNNNTWVVVNSACNHQYIGYVRGKTKQEVLDGLGEAPAEWLHLEEYIELLMPMRQVQQGGHVGVVRDPLPMNDGFMLHPAASYVKVSKITFFEDMNPEDARQYKQFFTQMQDQLVAARAGKLGIEIAGAINNDKSPIPSAIAR